MMILCIICLIKWGFFNKRGNNAMKKKIIYTLTLAAVAIGCFFIGRNTTNQPKETHVDRMEYALKNISYWEFAEDGETVLLYDYDGNIYEW